MVLVPDARCAIALSTTNKKGDTKNVKVVPTRASPASLSLKLDGIVDAVDDDDVDVALVLEGGPNGPCCGGWIADDVMGVLLVMQYVYKCVV